MTNIPSSSFKHNTTINNLYEKSWTYQENLEYRFNLVQDSFSMASLSKVEDTSDFHRTFFHLSRKAQHLFRLIQNWGYLQCFPSQYLLSKLLGISREWVNKLIKILCALNLIIKSYRHRKSCIYSIPIFLRKLDSKKSKKAALKSSDLGGEFTPEFTPSTLSSKEYVNLSKKRTFSNSFSQKKVPPEKVKPPPWLPDYLFFRKDHPELSKELDKSPSSW